MTSQVTDQAIAGADEPDVLPPPRGASFMRRAAGFWFSREWAAAWTLTAAFLALLFAGFAARYAANEWNRYFFDALE
ncbi:MAG: hypothetical protein K2Y29_15075, partial [Beijerinckiaceae bacterium]|nr:hypothetical protein [Beijerinckiaceae bacterium]